MNLHITKSKNAESFYIAKSYAKSGGGTSSKIIRKLGTLEQLLPEHGPTRDDVLAWAKNEVKLETEKYKKEKEAKIILIPFHADRQLDYGVQKFYRSGYLFPQSVYYGMKIHKICRKLKPFLDSLILLYKQISKYVYIIPLAFPKHLQLHQKLFWQN